MQIEYIRVKPYNSHCLNRNAVQNDHSSTQTDHVVNAVLTIQSSLYGFLRIQQIEERVRIFRQAGCEAYDLKMLVHPVQKLGSTRALQHIDMVHMTLDRDRYHEIGVGDRFK